jgi:hypothetical protein
MSCTSYGQSERENLGSNILVRFNPYTSLGFVHSGEETGKRRKESTGGSAASWTSPRKGSSTYRFHAEKVGIYDWAAGKAAVNRLATSKSHKFLPFPKHHIRCSYSYLFPTKKVLLLEHIRIYASVLLLDEYSSQLGDDYFGIRLK